jgi:hypothetical protein
MAKEEEKMMYFYAEWTEDEGSVATKRSAYVGAPSLRRAMVVLSSVMGSTASDLSIGEIDTPIYIDLSKDE